MGRRSTRHRKLDDLESSLTPMETETEEMGRYNGNASSYEDSLNSDQSRALSEMYGSFDVEDMTKEEFKSMLKDAPPLEVQSMFASHGDPVNTDEPLMRSESAESSSPFAAATSGETSSITRPLGASEASQEWDPELSVTLNRIGHFIREHPFNEDPLALHTVSERRAYTREIYDYARALRLSSSYAAQVVKEARRMYRKNRRVARILDWVDTAAQAGRTMEDELERIRLENGWDTDELEGNFHDDDEELETSFGTEIDDTAEILEEDLARNKPTDEVAQNRSRLDASVFQGKQPSSKAKIPKTTAKRERKRTRKRRRETATDSDLEKRSKKTAKRNGQPDAIVGNVETLNPKSKALEEESKSVKHAKSGHGSEQHPPTKNSKSRSTRRSSKKKRGMLHTSSTDPNDPARAIRDKSGAAENSSNQRKTLSAHSLAGEVTSLSRALQSAAVTEPQGDIEPENDLATWTGRTRTAEVNREAREDRGVLKRDQERKQDQDQTKSRNDQSPAVGTGRWSVRNQGFVFPNDAPNMTGVEGMGESSGGQARSDRLAARAGLGSEKDDGMKSVPESESDGEYDSVASFSKASDYSSIVATGSSPPSSTILEESQGGWPLGCSEQAELVIRQRSSGAVAPKVPKAQTTPRKPTRRRTPLTSPYFKKALDSKSKSRRVLKHSASCIPFPPISQQTFGLIQEKLAHEPFQLLVAATFLNRTRGIHAIPVFYSLMDRYPTPADLAAADEGELASEIRHLGLQNTRARRYIQLAKTWIEDPPVMGRRHRKLHYPNLGDGKDIKRGEIIDGEDERMGAWEVAHLPTTGPYAIDSWRIFCRDDLRGKTRGVNDEDTGDASFEPEWKKVVPLDKELRAYLKWRWLKEGWDWDPRTGRKVRASPELLKRAERGELYTEGGAVNSESDDEGQLIGVGMIAEEAVQKEPLIHQIGSTGVL